MPHFLTVAHRRAAASAIACRSLAEFFQLEIGMVTTFVPVAADLRSSGRIVMVGIPAAELAVAVHRGRLAHLPDSTRLVRPEERC